MLTPIKVATKLFNLPIIALTAHFKYHGSFDHEHSLPLLIKRSWFNYIYWNSRNNENWKKMNKMFFLYVYLYVFNYCIFPSFMLIKIHGNDKCIKSNWAHCFNSLPLKLRSWENFHYVVLFYFACIWGGTTCHRTSPPRRHPVNTSIQNIHWPATGYSEIKTARPQDRYNSYWKPNMCWRRRSTGLLCGRAAANASGGSQIFEKE